MTVLPSNEGAAGLSMWLVQVAPGDILLVSPLESDPHTQPKPGSPDGAMGESIKNQWELGSMSPSGGSSARLGTSGEYVVTENAHP